MPASVAGSERSTKGSRDGGTRKISTSRAQATIERNLATAFEVSDDLRYTVDFEYIVSELKGQHADLVDMMATMMRAGTLRNAINRKKAGVTPDALGKRLPPSTLCCRNLSPILLRSCLKAFEPTIFTDAWFDGDAEVEDGWEALSTEDMMHLVLYALQSQGKTKLPVEYECLRYEVPLVSYLAAIYVINGRPLKEYKRADPNSWVFFAVDGTDGKVWLRAEPAKSIIIATLQTYGLDTESGFVLCKNHSFEESCIENDAETITISLAAAFKKNKVQVDVVPAAVLECPERALPHNIQDKVAVAVQKTGGSAASVPDPSAPDAKRVRSGGVVKTAPPAKRS